PGAAVAAAALVFAAARFSLLLQRLQLFQRLDLFPADLAPIAINQLDDDRIAHGQNVTYTALAPGRADDLAAPGELPLGLDILLIRVDQAAAQPAAHARDLLRVERDPLLFSHLDGDRAELGQESRTAARPATGAVPAHHLGHIARPDELQLNLGTETAP